MEFHNELENIAKKFFNLRPKPVKSEPIIDHRGPCVHFTFVPSEILDNMPAFRQWRLSNQKSSPKTNVLSHLVIQGLRI